MEHRNDNAVKICIESSNGNECGGDFCPIRPACKWRPTDDRSVWIERTNKAADQHVESRQQ